MVEVICLSCNQLVKAYQIPGDVLRYERHTATGARAGRVCDNDGQPVPINSQPLTPCSFPETVSEYLNTHKCKGFKPVPTYSLIGDMLILYFEDEPAYSEQLNPQVTLERAFSDKRIVGVKIFGVEAMVDKANHEANLQDKAQ